MVAKGPVEPFTISGLAEFAGQESLGGATFAIFTLPRAQELFDKEGMLDGISIAASDGVSPEQLVQEIEPILPPSTQVQTGVQETQDATQDVEEFTNIIQYFLLAFGIIALFVGAFVIFNTLSITVAQRVREFATLRTIGASRRQVRLSVILEALVIGALASVTGLFLGLGLAKGLSSIFAAIGFDMPQAGIVFAPRTIIVSLLAGILITLFAGLVPAMRATRVPPIAAVREGATLPPSRFSRFAPVPLGPHHRGGRRHARLRHARRRSRHGRAPDVDRRGLSRPVHRRGGALVTARPASRPRARLAGRADGRGGRHASPARTRCATRVAPPRPPPRS